MKVLIIKNNKSKNDSVLINAAQGLTKSNDVYLSSQKNVKNINGEFDYVFIELDTVEFISSNLVKFINNRTEKKLHVNLLSYDKWYYSYQVYEIGYLLKLNADDDKFGGKIKPGINVTKNYLK